MKFEQRELSPTNTPSSNYNFPFIAIHHYYLLSLPFGRISQLLGQKSKQRISVQVYAFLIVLVVLQNISIRLLKFNMKVKLQYQKKGEPPANSQIKKQE